MTLLELIVGLTVTGLALTAGFGALGMLGERRERLEAAMNTVARAATLRAAIVAWLGDARLVAEEGGPGFRGLDGDKERTPDDDLTFVTTAPTPLGTGETIVRLYVDRDTATAERGLTAVFAEWRGLALTRVELDTSITGVDIRYLSGVLGRRAWLPSWISSTLLPAGVELRLLAAPADTLAPLLRMPILVPFRNGQ
jgi:type II secretory pathway pseudopilin PulG